MQVINHLQLGRTEELFDEDFQRMKRETIEICERVVEEPGPLRDDYVTLAKCTLVNSHNCTRSFTHTFRAAMLHAS